MPCTVHTVSETDALGMDKLSKDFYAIAQSTRLECILIIPRLIYSDMQFKL